MASNHEKALLSSLATLLSNPKFLDLVLKCDGQEFSHPPMKRRVTFFCLCCSLRRRLLGAILDPYSESIKS
jgi:hypothetical protein